MNINVKESTVSQGRHQNATSYQAIINQRDGEPLKVAHVPMFTEICR